MVKTKDLLHQFGLRPKKRLGQHFLVDEGVLQRIILAAELTATDTVIEVGPGLGVLTIELAKRAGRVIAVEADARLATALKQFIAPFPNVSIINSDILQTDPALLLASNESYKVVANLPYYITSPTLRHFLEASHQPQSMVVMVQKEVGEAIVAQPGGMSLLAVSVQFYGKPVIIDYVSPQCFYPPPKVDSVILRVDIYEEPEVKAVDRNKFFELVRAGFYAPRKQLRNSLAKGLGLSPQKAANLLEKARIEPHRRAESLSLQEWANLSEVAYGSKV